MTTLEIICLYGLAVCLGALLIAAAGRRVRDAWKRCGRRYGLGASLFGLAVVCTISAQKPSTITFDALIADAGSYATNDVLHVAATNATAYAGFDFSASPLLVYRRDRDSTNAADWAECLPRRTFGDLPADWSVPDATNYNYMVYLDYVPPSPVHTNGVFEMTGFEIPSTAERAAGFINSTPKGQ